MCSYKQPCSIAVEFGAVVYVTDAIAASVHVITKLEKNVESLQSVGALYDAFSIHTKGEKVNHLSLPEASARIKPCLDFLLDNQSSIRESVRQTLLKDMDGRHGDVASKTIRSVDLVY